VNAELQALKEALAKSRREAEERATRERAAALEAEHDRALFARSVGAVQSLGAHERAPKIAPRADPTPRQRKLDDAAVLRESVSDEVDVESLLDTDDTLSFHRPDLGPDVVRKLRRGHWAIQAQIDLHGLRRDQARERLGAFLRDAVSSGLRCLRVVHGKGNGSPGREPVLKSRVRGWLMQKSDVIAFVQARASEGGSGALIVLLRP